MSHKPDLNFMPSGPPLADPAGAARHADIALSLAWAVVESSVTPLVLLDEDLNVVVASASFCTAFELELDAVQGRHFCRLGLGEWEDAPLRALLTAAASGEGAFAAFELDLVRAGKPPRHLILNAHRLNLASPDDVRVILGVADATDARAAELLKDELLSEAALLLREVRHRVANSLQIIAGVLMQTARKVGSDDARGHLQDAHHRVMAVAALERQLSKATLGQVVVKTYIAELCASLAAALAPNSGQVVIEVMVDDSLVDAQMSISLGLIVTELVINALKHAFPEGREGKVTVAYASDGAGWALTVKDDGSGRPKGSEPERQGLGTAIIQGLARQCRAVVSVADARPGTEVSVAHRAPDT